nr:dihydropteroate synthase [Granulosicoccus sp.]
MGILNVTPDSFSDGGVHIDPAVAIEAALSMREQGAHIIDIGGESTRPGAADVALEDEINRVVPVIEALVTKDIPISIDTSKPAVMRAAVRAGACLINDVRALREPGALEAAVELQVPVCLMHMQGEPRSMQEAPAYDDVLAEVLDFLQQRIEACVSAGLDRSLLLTDP